jgi:hypothetical protein
MNVGTDVVITWPVPVDNYAEVTSFDLKIKNSAGSFVQALSYCDEDAATILSSQTCTLPLETLRTLPFSLNYNSLVVAIVSS